MRRGYLKKRMQSDGNTTSTGASPRKRGGLAKLAKKQGRFGRSRRRRR